MHWDRHLRELLRFMAETPAEQTQREVQEIAEVLSSQSGRSVLDVWDEALRLHRVRFESERLIDDREDEP
jgi:hypothetical protein